MALASDSNQNHSKHVSLRPIGDKPLWITAARLSSVSRASTTVLEPTNLSTSLRRPSFWLNSLNPLMHSDTCSKIMDSWFQTPRCSATLIAGWYRLLQSTRWTNASTDAVIVHAFSSSDTVNPRAFSSSARAHNSSSDSSITMVRTSLHSLVTSTVMVRPAHPATVDWRQNVGWRPGLDLDQSVEGEEDAGVYVPSVRRPAHRPVRGWPS